MRTKISLVALCFTITMALVAYMVAPHVVIAIQTMGQPSPQEEGEGARTQSGIVWTRAYPETSSAATTGKFSADSVLDAPDGYLIIGRNSTGGGQWPVPKTYLLRVDREGNTIWEKTIQEGIQNGIHYADACEDDTYLLVGSARYPDPERDLLWFMKIDDQGNCVWRNDFEPQTRPTRGWTLKALDREEGESDNGNGFIFIEEGFLTKLGPEGSMVWQKTWQPATWCFERANTEGFFAAWVPTIDSTRVNQHVTFGRLDQNCELVWQIPLGGLEYAALIHVVQTTDGGVLVLSQRGPEGSPPKAGIWIPTIHLVRLDDEGRLLWEMNYSVQHDIAHTLGDLTRLSDGSRLITGSAGSHAFLIRTDPKGDVSWSESYETDIRLGRAFETDDGGFLFFDGYMILKMDHVGNRIWEYEGNWKGGNVFRASSCDFLIAGSTAAEIDGEEVELASLTMLSIGSDPPTPEAVLDEVIYDEGQEQWALDPAPALTIDRLSAATCTSGEVSMAVTNPRYGYMDLYPPGEEGFDTYGYLTIDLALNRGNCTTFVPQLVGQFKYGGSFSLDLTKIATFPEDRWVKVSLSLKELGADHRTIEMIRLGGYTPGTYYLDNLRFVSNIPEITYISVAAIFLLCIRPGGTCDKQRRPNTPESVE